MLIGGSGTETRGVSKQLKNIGVVSAFTMVSRVLGLVRESVTAMVFGTRDLVSAFYTGQTLPNLFRRLLAEGALTAAFVPTLNDELGARERAGAFSLVNQVMSWLSAVTVGLVLLSMALLGQDWLVRFIAQLVHTDAAALDRWLLASWFGVLLFPYLIFVSLAAVFSAALQTLHRFVEPALSPIWLNLAQIGLLAAGVKWGSGDQICWLSVGVLIGGFLQMIVPAVALMHEGWRPAFDFKLSPAVRSMLRLMAPTVFASSVYLVNMSVSRLVGLSLNDAAVAVLNYAQRLMELPIGVFAVAVSTVVFPLITRYAAAGDMANLTRSYRRGMRLILVINIPAAVGLALLALPIIRVLFQRGAFSSGDSTIMTPVLVANAVGLPFFSFVNLVLRAFYAQKDTATPVRGALVSFVVNLGLSFALMHRYGTVGLAVAGNIAIAVQAVYLQWHLARKHHGLAFHHLAKDLAKVFVASAVMGVVVWAAWWGWQHQVVEALYPIKHDAAGAAIGVLANRLAQAAGLGVVIGLGVAVYGALLWTMRIEGREDLSALWAKFRSKAGR